MAGATGGLTSGRGRKFDAFRRRRPAPDFRPRPLATGAWDGIESCLTASSTTPRVRRPVARRGDLRRCGRPPTGSTASSRRSTRRKRSARWRPASWRPMGSSSRTEPGQPISARSLPSSGWLEPARRRRRHPVRRGDSSSAWAAGAALKRCSMRPMDRDMNLVLLRLGGRVLPLAAVVLLGAVGSASAATVAPRATASVHVCRPVPDPLPTGVGEEWAVKVRAVRTSCAVARTLPRKFILNARYGASLRGWSCDDHGGNGGWSAPVVCTASGERRVSWRLADHP